MTIKLVYEHSGEPDFPCGASIRLDDGSFVIGQGRNWEERQGKRLPSE
jgi:hypothetical protein